MCGQLRSGPIAALKVSGSNEGERLSIKKAGVATSEEAFVPPKGPSKTKMASLVVRSSNGPYLGESFR
jgi:hypothetical protein